jgi:hypothetical protein
MAVAGQLYFAYRFIHKNEILCFIQAILHCLLKTKYFSSKDCTGSVTAGAQEGHLAPTAVWFSLNF